MRFQLSPSERTIAIQRLTALWALNECGLGGILHAFNSPFTGLLVGGLAMVCIAFICYLAENKWRSVMAALVIVLLIKATVSPHSSPTAYIAVTFQAVTGALIYRYIPNLLFGSLLFFCLGHIESATQRLIMLTVLYGNTLWEALNIWGEMIAKRWGVLLSLTSSQLIIYTYLIIHFVAGLIMGWITYRILLAVQRQWGQGQYVLALSKKERIAFSPRTKSKKFRWKRLVLLAILISFIAIAYTFTPDPSSAGQKALITLLRVISILVVWFVFIAPLVMRGIQSFLKKRYQHLADDVAHTMDMFPQLLWILDTARKETLGMTFIKRWKSFVILSMLYLLQYKTIDDPDTDRADTKL